MGPVLWNIYQNDLFYENLISHLSMYADDHHLYSSNQTTEDSAKVLEIDGKITGEWCKVNYLEGNLSKYQVMMITKRKSDIVDIDNHALAQMDQMKLLGVTLDKESNFSNHVSSICKNTSKRIGVLMRLRKLILTTAKLYIYKAAIMPYFNYCSLVLIISGILTSGGHDLLVSNTANIH